MSSGFVSGGTIEHPTERDDEWRRAQQEIEDKRREREDLGRQNDGKSLFEVLQANKAAKQEAFEEASRLKNQFRALNDDEAEYLDSVLEAKRQQEAAVNKETSEQLDAFRRQQEEAERKALEEQDATVGDGPSEGEVKWVATGAAHKRKKGGEAGLLKGFKRRKSLNKAEEEKEEVVVRKSVGGDENNTTKSTETTSSTSMIKKSETTAKNTAKKPVNPVSLGLGYASSDEDD